MGLGPGEDLVERADRRTLGAGLGYRPRRRGPLLEREEARRSRACARHVVGGLTCSGFLHRSAAGEKGDREHADGCRRRLHLAAAVDRDREVEEYLVSLRQLALEPL